MKSNLCCQVNTSIDSIIHLTRIFFFSIMLTVVNKKERKEKMISKSLEEYLKNIYLIKKQNKQPRVTDIAEKMNCSKASVNKSIKILSEEKLVKYEAYGQIEITEEGTRLAKKILEANDIVYLFLTEVLEEEKQIAEEEAKDIKKAMNDTTLNKLAKYLHKELGLYSLDCGYDINKEQCIDCMRRKETKVEK